MDASKITVCKENMSVVQPEQLGLSPFGKLSLLFQQELEQRVRMETGAYAPLPLTLLEDEEPRQREQPRQPVEVNLSLDVHLDAPKSTHSAREPEKKPARREQTPKEKGAQSPQARGAALETRILEKIRIRERELREKQEVLHRLEIRLEEKGTAVSAARAQSAARQAAARTIELASQAASVPAAGGWVPQTRQTHPGYPAPRKAAAEEQRGGRSILLPDVLRRRREEALRSQKEPDLAWTETQKTPSGTSDELMQTVRRAVEETLEHNRSQTAAGLRQTAGPGQEAKPFAGGAEEALRPASLTHREPSEPPANQDRPDQSPRSESREPLSRPEARPSGGAEVSQGSEPLTHREPSELEPRTPSKDIVHTAEHKRLLVDQEKAAAGSPAAAIPRAAGPRPEGPAAESGAETSSPAAGRPDSRMARPEGTEPEESPAMSRARPAEDQNQPAPALETLVYREQETDPETTASRSGRAVPQSAQERTAPAAPGGVKSAGQAETIVHTAEQKSLLVDEEKAAAGDAAAAASRAAVSRQENPAGKEKAGPGSVNRAAGRPDVPAGETAAPEEVDGLSQALPAETLSQTGPAQETLIYRDAETAPEETAQPGRTASKPAESRRDAPARTMASQEKTTLPAAGQKARSPEEPQAHREGTASPAEPQYRETSPAVRPDSIEAATPEESLSQALPAETLSQTGPAQETLIYRDAETAPEETAQPGRTASKPAESRTDAPARVTTAQEQTTLPAAGRKARSQEEPQAHREGTASPAEPRYRETSPAVRPGSIEAAAPEEADGLSQALPAETLSQTGPAQETLIYRDAEAAPEEAAQPGRTASKPAESRRDAPARVTIAQEESTLPAASRKARSPEEPQAHREGNISPAEPQYRETSPAVRPGSIEAAPEEALSQALPAETLSQAGPAQETLIYRDAETAPEETAQPGRTASKPAESRTDAPARVTTAQEKTTLPAAGQKARLQEEPQAHREGTASPAEPLDRETSPAVRPGSIEAAAPEEADSLSQALPAETLSQTGPAQETLIYRDGETAPAEAAQPGPTASKPASRTGAPARVTTAQEKTTLPAASQKARSREESQAHREGNTSPAEPLYRETSPAVRPGSIEAATPEESLSQALPAETLSQAEPAQETLIYRDAETAPEESLSQALPAETMSQAGPAQEALIYRDGETSPDQAPRPASEGSQPRADLPGMELQTARLARPAGTLHQEIPLTLRQLGTQAQPNNRTSHQETASHARDIRLIRPSGARAEGESGEPDLILAQAAGAPRTDRQEDTASSLPGWAQELLEKGPITRSAAQPGAGGKPPMQWTAPYAQPAQPAMAPSRPASLTQSGEVPPELRYHTRGEEDGGREMRSQAERKEEIRRTADQVYRIIEERLRRELRRSGR